MGPGDTIFRTSTPGSLHPKLFGRSSKRTGKCTLLVRGLVSKGYDRQVISVDFLKILTIKFSGHHTGLVNLKNFLGVAKILYVVPTLAYGIS